MKLFVGLSTTDYQDTMRAIGALIDQHGLRDIRLWEHEDGVILQGRTVLAGDPPDYQTFLLTDDDLRSLLTDAYRQRGLTPHRFSLPG